VKQHDNRKERNIKEKRKNYKRGENKKKKQK